MSPESIIAIIGGLLALSAIATAVYVKLPKKIKRPHYTFKWRNVQRLCAQKEQWPQAIVNADEMLDEVLKKKRKIGKTMGERMVSAQKAFTNNDAVWQAHKLANHVRHSKEVALKEADVREALVAFRQALRDLGAL